MMDQSPVPINVVQCVIGHLVLVAMWLHKLCASSEIRFWHFPCSVKFQPQWDSIGLRLHTLYHIDRHLVLIHHALIMGPLGPYRKLEYKLGKRHHCDTVDYNGLVDCRQIITHCCQACCWAIQFADF